MPIRGAETTGTEGRATMIEIGTAGATDTTIVEMTGAGVGVTTIVGTTAVTIAAAAAGATTIEIEAAAGATTIGAEAEGEAGATIGAAVGDTTTAGTPPQPAPRWLILSVACLVLSRAECGSPSDDDLYRPLALCSPPCLRYLHS